MLQRIDIVDIIDEHLPLKRTGTNYLALCPFHEEKTPSFHVSQVKQVYHCFGCNAGGNIISFLIEYEHLGFVEVIEKLAARLGLAVPREGAEASNSSPAKSYNEYFDLLGKISEFYIKQLSLNPMAKLAKEYLTQRGISPDIATQFQLGFAPGGAKGLVRVSRNPNSIEQLIATGMVKKDSTGLKDLYYKRIMFPIHNVRGQIIGFGGRVIDSKQFPKYINSPETQIFKKSQELYGLYQCLKKQRAPEKILVVEGYMDVIALAQFGIDYAVATMGTATSKGHLQRLSRYTKKIIFCFDGDNAGKQAAWRALTLCLTNYQDGLLFRFMFLPPNEDPDTLIRTEGTLAFEQRIANATTLPDFFFQHLQQQVDLATLDGKSAFIKLVTSFLETMPTCTLKYFLEEKLGQFTNLSQAHVHSLLKNDDEPKPSLVPNPTSRLSLLQRAISLLLQYPTLVKCINFSTPLALPPGIEHKLLEKIIVLLQTDPTLTTGALLEHWRETKYFTKLTNWSNYAHLLPVNSLETEFNDILQQLQKEELKYKIEQLYAKVRSGNATLEERHELQQLIGKSKEKTNISD